METVTISREEHQRLIQAAEDLADIEVFASARANPEEGVPHEYVVRLIEGEQPLTVFREWHGLSQAELSRRSGVNRVQIHDIESRKRGCSVTTLKKLADTLDIPMDDLVDGGVLS